MSGIEHYVEELAQIDREIEHYAAICGVDLADHDAVKRCLKQPHGDWADDKARASLHGLLVLRIKVEGEMIAEGLVPRELNGW
ncbi:hypothetical protein [Rhodocyclus tenuis]|uniref:Uncharacterized protein n=1 Tax=Rhodocyclus tenuis TaxID=1066 RepID=A0A840FXE5_RHOTE|nr:hypothetical protein [Rhodocyclus tenuis]MBB4246464.1 hypothetical protein [Rhodocyclus tenuis]MBK1681717.1 hypothetical protein [Rhodocyclus tenuis]